MPPHVVPWLVDNWIVTRFRKKQITFDCIFHRVGMPTSLYSIFRKYRDRSASPELTFGPPAPETCLWCGIPLMLAAGESHSCGGRDVAENASDDEAV